MKESMKQELLKCIGVSKDAMKNNMEITLDTYTEVISRLDMLAYLILCESKKC